MNKIIILIIDDDTAFTESTKDLLEAYGYTVVIANNGTEGYRLATKIVPDIIILDVIMTTVNEGFEVARKISETTELAQIPIILVTGIVKEMNISVSMEGDRKWLPVESIFDKPVPPARLIIEIERICKKLQKSL